MIYAIRREDTGQYSLNTHNDWCSDPGACRIFRSEKAVIKAIKALHYHVGYFEDGPMLDLVFVSFSLSDGHSVTHPDRDEMEKEWAGMRDYRIEVRNRRKAK